MLMKGMEWKNNSSQMLLKPTQVFIYKTAGEQAKLRIAHAGCRDWNFKKWQLMLFRENRNVAVSNGFRWDKVKPLIQFLSADQ